MSLTYAVRRHIKLVLWTRPGYPGRLPRRLKKAWRRSLLAHFTAEWPGVRFRLRWSTREGWVVESR